MDSPNRNAKDDDRDPVRGSSRSPARRRRGGAEAVLPEQHQEAEGRAERDHVDHDGLDGQDDRAELAGQQQEGEEGDAAQHEREVAVHSVVEVGVLRGVAADLDAAGDVRERRTQPVTVARPAAVSPSSVGITLKQRSRPVTERGVSGREDRVDARRRARDRRGLRGCRPSAVGEDLDREHDGGSARRRAPGRCRVSAGGRCRRGSSPGLAGVHRQRGDGQPEDDGQAGARGDQRRRTISAAQRSQPRLKVRGAPAQAVLVQCRAPRGEDRPAAA